jgi:nicotinamidase-related amidase
MRRPLSIDPTTAMLLCIDLQEEHRGDPRLLAVGYDAVLANAARLQRAARAAGLLVAHAAYVVETGAMRRFHPVLADGRSYFSDRDDPLTALCPEVAPVGGESLLVKAEASAFGDGRLERMLREAGVEWIFVTGVWSEACVDATVKQAVAAGFRVALVKDACGSGSEAMHQTAILNLANRLYGGAVVSTDAAVGLMAGGIVEAWQVEGAVPLRWTYQDAKALYEGL